MQQAKDLASKKDATQEDIDEAQKLALEAKEYEKLARQVEIDAFGEAKDFEDVVPTVDEESSVTEEAKVEEAKVEEAAPIEPEPEPKPAPKPKQESKADSEKQVDFMNLQEPKDRVEAQKRLVEAEGYKSEGIEAVTLSEGKKKTTLSIDEYIEKLRKQVKEYRDQEAKIKEKGKEIETGKDVEIDRRDPKESKAIPEEQLGKKVTVYDGNKAYNVTLAILDADQITQSNDPDTAR